MRLYCLRTHGRPWWFVGVAVKVSSRKLWQLRGCLGSECLAQTRGAVTDSVEREPKQRVGDLNEVRVIRDECAAVGRLEGDPVRRDDGRALAAKCDGVWRVVLDDAVGEGGLSAEELGHEPELGALTDGRVANALGFNDT